MRLNPDCIRDILTYIEDNSIIVQDKYRSVSLNDMIPKYNYTIEELAYHIKQLEIDKLVFGVACDIALNYSVEDLTPDGHRFLANIRNDDNWSKTKEITRSVGGFSIQMLKNVSESVLVALINKKLGL